MLSALLARLGARYLILYLAFELVSALLLALVAIALIAIYHPLTAQQFELIFAVTAAFVCLALAWSTARVRPHAAALLGWLNNRDQNRANEAWRCAAELPLAFVRVSGIGLAVLAIGPPLAFVVVVLSLPIWTAPIIAAVALIGVGYWTILHFFASELALRPIHAALESQLATPPKTAGIPLRWRLMIALPTINLITGVLAAGLAHAAPHSLAAALPSLAAAIAAGFLAALVLTALVIDSLLHPIDHLLHVTRRVHAGDLSARAHLAPGGEIARLADSYNQMLTGLSERVALHEALSSYVHPAIAHRVLNDGAELVP